MSERTSVKVLNSGDFDHHFRNLVSDDPKLGAKLLSRIEEFASSRAGSHSVIKDLEIGTLVQLRVENFRIIMFVDQNESAIYLISLVANRKTKLDSIKNFSAISLLKSAIDFH